MKWWWDGMEFSVVGNQEGKKEERGKLSYVFALVFTLHSEREREASNQTQHLPTFLSLLYLQICLSLSLSLSLLSLVLRPSLVVDRYLNKVRDNSSRNGNNEM